MNVFTLVHVVISLLAIATGLVVVFGLLTGKPFDRWTAVFLATTVATSVTGFGFPADRVLPSHIVGGISLVLLAAAIYARYARHLSGIWRSVYAVGAVSSLYLNLFVLVVQAFLRVPRCVPWRQRSPSRRFRWRSSSSSRSPFWSASPRRSGSAACPAPSRTRNAAMTNASLIVSNARITTMDATAPEASALAVRDGRFLAVGSAADVDAHRGPGTLALDAAGRRIVPGLNDSHIHVIRGGLNYNLELRWDGVPSLADALRMLKEQAARTPPPQWVRVVGGWSEFQFAERRMPTLAGDQRRRRRRRRCSCSISTIARWLNGAALRARRLYEGHARPARRDDRARPHGAIRPGC